MFLISQDYDKIIQKDNLTQIVSSDFSQKIKMELAAQAEVTSYLAQRYDISKIFQDSTPFSLSTTYLGGQWTYLDGSAYNVLTAYTLNNILSNNGIVYCKNSNFTSYVAGILPTNTSYFTVIGNQYDFYNALYPFPLFSLSTSYSLGDKVYWKDSVYTITSTTMGVYPNNTLYFSSGVPFSGVVGIYPTDITKWKQGYVRNQQIIVYIIDIVLYHIHARIAPRNIPELREDRYKSAIAWLKMAARGEITADLPLLSPDQGNRIRWGSNKKNINNTNDY